MIASNMIDSTKKFSMQSILLLILPIIILVTGHYYLIEMLPLYSGPLGFDMDPGYQYFLNGLSILDGVAPGHIDHPGTPLQLFSALIILLKWIITCGINLNINTSDFFRDVIQNSESYIKTICYVLLLLNTWACYFVGKKIYQSSKLICLSLVVQMSSLAFWQLSPRLVYLCPEALLFFCSLLLAGLLAKYIFKENQTNNSINQLELFKVALICAIGITTKVTFAPFCISLLFIWNRKYLINILLSIMLLIGIILIPIYTKLPWMYGWFYSLATHSGIYGSGENKFIDASLIPGVIIQLANEIPLYFILSIVLIAFLPINIILSKRVKLLKKIKEDRRSVNIIFNLIFISIFILQTLIVIKHYRIHYMVPAIPFTFLGISWIFYSLQVSNIPNVRQISARLLWVVLCILFLNLVRQSYFSYDLLKSERVIMNQSNSVIMSSIHSFNNPIIVGAYRCHLIECALAFGGSYVSNNARLAALLKQHFYFNIWNKKLLSFGSGYVDLSILQPYLDANADVLLISPPNYKELSLFNTTLITTDGTNSPYQQSLYRINSINQGMYK